MVLETGGTLPDAPPNAFTDDDGNTHEANINKAAEQGVASGYADGTYGPLDNVLRDQMASFLARLLDLLVVNGFATLPPAQPVYLGYDITSVEDTCCWFADPVNINGVAYARGVGNSQPRKDVDFIEFDLSRDYVRLTAVLGIPIDLDVSGVLRLRLTVINLSESSSSTAVAYPTFADPAVLTY